jgi:hypothetical protein
MQQSCIADVATIGSDWTDLCSYTIPADMLWNDGDTVKYKTFGDFTETILNGKHMKLFVGNTVVFDTTSLLHNGGSFTIKAGIIKS